MFSCSAVYLSDSKQDCTKPIKLVSIKFGCMVQHEQRKNTLNCEQNIASVETRCVRRKYIQTYKMAAVAPLHITEESTAVYGGSVCSLSALLVVFVFPRQQDWKDLQGLVFIFAPHWESYKKGRIILCSTHLVGIKGSFHSTHLLAANAFLEAYTWKWVSVMSVFTGWRRMLIVLHMTVSVYIRISVGLALLCGEATAHMLLHVKKKTAI